MRIFDAHNDTMSQLFDLKQDLYQNCLHIDLQRLTAKQHLEYTLLSAVFILPKETRPFWKANAILDAFIAQIQRYDDIAGRMPQKKPVSFLFSIEGGHVLLGNPKHVQYFYEKGVRAIALTWNEENELAGGTKTPEKGLTSLGHEMLQAMSSLHMVLDLSHLSDRGVEETLDSYDKKIIASHSNVRALCDHPRNLTDAQILKIARRGGVIGINFYPFFLTGNPQAKISDILRHIDYVVNLGGIDCVGIGSDFDGIDQLPLDMGGMEDIESIAEGLLKLGYTMADIKKIMGENFLEIFDPQKTLQKVNVII